MRNIAVLLLVAAFTLSAAPAARTRPRAAPDEIPHAFALYLTALSSNGERQVTYKARAHGVRFFFEEPGGVTVYRFEKGRYVKEEFLREVTLERAVGRYSKR